MEYRVWVEWDGGCGYYYTDNGHSVFSYWEAVAVVDALQRKGLQAEIMEE